MVPSINQIIVNQSVVLGCDWIDWKPPNILELTLTGFQDSSFTLFTPLPDTVPWVPWAISGKKHRKWGLHSDSDPRCPRCWHFYRMFWPILHVFLVARKTIGLQTGHGSWGRKAIRGPIPWHSQCRMGSGVHGNKNFPCWNSPIVWSQSYVISTLDHGGCRGRFLRFFWGMGLVNGVWSQIMPVLWYPSLDLYPAVAGKTPTST